MAGEVKQSRLSPPDRQVARAIESQIRGERQTQGKQKPPDVEIPEETDPGLQQHVARGGTLPYATARVLEQGQKIANRKPAAEKPAETQKEDNKAIVPPSCPDDMRAHGWLIRDLNHRYGFSDIDECDFGFGDYRYFNRY